MKDETSEAETPGDRRLSDVLRTVRRLEQEAHALRDAVVGAESDPANRASLFRRERLNAIADGDTPVPLRQGPLLVLHVLPHSAFGNPERWLPIDKSEFLIFGRGGSPTYNALGKVMWPDDRASDEQYGYAQLGRTGWFEAVRALRQEEMGAPRSFKLYIAELEQLMVGGTTEYIAALRTLGVEGPAVATATLLHAKGYRLFHGGSYSTSNLPITSDEIVLPAVHVETPVSEAEIPALLRSALDVLWQTGGWAYCSSFDQQGQYGRR
jgi:hypothetical protein